MSEFISIISNQRRLKAQLKELPIEEIRAIHSKFETVLSQMEELDAERQKEQQQKQEKIAQLKEEAARLGINLNDLVDAPAIGQSKKSKEPKYEYITDDGKRKTWTGQGRTPKPIQEAIDNGKSLEDHLIKQ